MSASSMSIPLLDLRRRRIPSNVEELNAHDVLRIAIETLGADRVALSASFGPEDIVLLDLLRDIEPEPRVFTLDTGRLPQQTYDLMDRVRDFFKIDIEVFFPDAESVESMVRERGVNLFYNSIDERRRCCDVRKVEPLGRALATVDGWITGLRRDQIQTRAATPKIGFDLEHGLIWKVAPLVEWTEQEVWAHIRRRGLPYNTLHDHGYPSIGCAPCSRAVAPGDDPRSGRWWWELPEDRECGLHVAPIMRPCESALR
jgi:phosphoadenosine phosphosulfate reductase